MDKAFICLQMHDNIGGRGEELERSGNSRDRREPYFWILNTERIGEWKFRGGKVVSSHCCVRLGGEGNVVLVVRLAATCHSSHCPMT